MHIGSGMLEKNLDWTLCTVMHTGVEIMGTQKAMLDKNLDWTPCTVMHTGVETMGTQKAMLDIYVWFLFSYAIFWDVMNYKLCLLLSCHNATL